MPGRFAMHNLASLASALDERVTVADLDTLEG